MAQNYPLYRVVHGNWAPSSNIEMFCIEYGNPTGPNGTNVQWNLLRQSQWDPNNNNQLHPTNPASPGSIYLVGAGAWGYSTSAAAEAAANAYAQSLCTARDNAAAAVLASQGIGDITQAVGWVSATPLVVFGPE